ncbi:MAG: LPXTG cell wall anchor domain-containing protein, partial [Thermoplasmata archaeon]
AITIEGPVSELAEFAPVTPKGTASTESPGPSATVIFALVGALAVGLLLGLLVARRRRRGPDEEEPSFGEGEYPVLEPETPIVESPEGWEGLPSAPAEPEPSLGPEFTYEPEFADEPAYPPPPQPPRHEPSRTEEQDASEPTEEPR